VDEITPYPNNPRVNDGAVEAVARSIREFGFRQPIVVDQATASSMVGHTRWKAAKHLGLERVPVHVADLTPEQAKAYRLADNRTALISDLV
jgi:ParB/RepB/Spo0J family partition protein